VQIVDKHAISPLQPAQSFDLSGQGGDGDGDSGGATEGSAA
jgi:hypothetical protein